MLISCGHIFLLVTCNDEKRRPGAASGQGDLATMKAQQSSCHTFFVGRRVTGLTCLFFIRGAAFELRRRTCVAS
jgi:hypothetical protein